MAMACSSLWQVRPGFGPGNLQQPPAWTGRKRLQGMRGSGLFEGSTGTPRTWIWREATVGARNGLVVRGSSSQRWQARLRQQCLHCDAVTEGAIGIRCSSWLMPGGNGGRQPFVPLEVSVERRGGRLRVQASKDNADNNGSFRMSVLRLSGASIGAGQTLWDRLIKRQVQIEVTAQETVHLVVSLGIFVGLDKVLKEGFAAASIRFPSALFGMLCLFAVLTILDVIRPSAAASAVSFFQPANTFIQRWLPIFYVPSLVMIPLSVKGIPVSDGAKIAVILVAGWLTTLAVAGYTAVTVRKIVQTELKPGEPIAKPTPFSDWEVKALVSALLLSFAFVSVSPTALGSLSLTALPFLVSATVVGYVFGSGLPADLRKVFHPIIVCALSADLAAYLLGATTGLGFETALGAYLTKSPGNPGAGDVLMGVLGSVILSFAFSMFKQRKLVQRHAAEIFSAVAASSLYALYATAAAGRLLGLEKSLIAAIIPRSVTVALALPIASLLEATNTSLAAACVVLTGLIGANFSQVAMDKLGLHDPISRGMATASSGHGLGTAALSAKEPEALPFCAIAYALTGIFCSVICTIPVVRESLLALAGA